MIPDLAFQNPDAAAFVIRRSAPCERENRDKQQIEVFLICMNTIETLYRHLARRLMRLGVFLVDILA